MKGLVITNEIKCVRIMGYGGGPGCCYGNRYEGLFKCETLETSNLLKFTALENGKRKYGNKETISKGEIFYVSNNCIQEMY